MSTLIPIALTLLLVFFLCLFACALYVLVTVLRRVMGEAHDPANGGSTPHSGGHSSQCQGASNTARTHLPSSPTPLTIPGWYWPSNNRRPDEPSFPA